MRSVELRRAATPPTVTSVAISPTSLTVPLNTQTTFTAVVNLANSSTSTTTTVTWEVNGVSGGDLATIGSIAPAADNQLEGIYTAPSSVPSQTISGVTQVGQVAITAVTTQTDTTERFRRSPARSPPIPRIVTVGAGSGLDGFADNSDGSRRSHAAIHSACSMA